LKERQLIEVALRQSEERFRQMAETSLQGIVIVQHDRIVYANPAAANITECTSQELTGSLVGGVTERFIDSDSLELVRAKLNDTNYGMPQRSSYEIKVHTTTGMTCWIEVTAMPVMYEGAPAIQVVLIDKTMRREAEEALRDSEERYRTLVENAQNAIFSMEHDGTLVFLNSVAGGMLGGEAGDFVGKNVMDLFPPDQAARHLAAIQRVIDSGKGETIENLTELQGQPRWHLTSIHPLNGQDGRAKSAFLISTDITESKLTAEKLARECDFTKLILQTANSLIFCLDKDARITLFNEECERVTGYSSEEVIGKRWHDIFIPERYRHDGFDDFAAWVYQHPADRREEPILTKSGGERIILWSNSSFVHPDTGEITAIAIGYDITEAKQVGQRLKETESRFRSLVEGIPALTYTAALDATSTTTYISPQIENLLGYTPDEYITNPGIWAELIHPDDYDRVLAEVQHCHHTGEPFLSEYRMIHRNGNIVWFRDQATILRDESGKPLCLQGMQYDITESKAALEKLRESERRFKELADLLPQMVFEFDTNGKFTFINRNGFEESGLTPEDLEKGVSVLSVLHPDDRERAWQNIINLGSGSQSTDNEYTAIRSDGTQLSVLAYATQIYRNGEVIGYRGILIDITKRKQIEQALRESEEAFRDLVENVDDVLYTLDRDLAITYVSPVVKSVLGYDPSELVGRSALSLVYGEDLPAVHKEIEDVLGGNLHPSEYRMVTKTGEVRWVRTQSRPMFEGDIFTGTRGVLADVHDRKQAEEALQEKDEFLSSIIENIPDMIFVKDAEELRFVRFNKAGEELLGYKREDLIGKNDYDFFPREQADSFTRKDREVLEIGQLHEISEEPIDTKHGRRILHTKKIPIVEKDGKSTFLLGISRDITDHKRAQEALIESEERFRALYKGSPLPTYTWQWNGSNFVLIDCNDAATRGFEGYTRNYLGLTASKIYENQPECIRDIQSCYENQAIINREMKYVAHLSTGKAFELAVRYNFVPPDLVLVVAEDITQRKRDDEALRMSEERFRVLIENQGEGIGIVDLNEVFQFANPAARRIMGVPTGELIGRNLSEFVSPEDWQAILDQTLRRQEGLSATYELNIVRPDGIRRRLLVTGTPQSGTEGVVSGTFGIFRDITDIKQMEEALRSTNELLVQEHQALNEKNIALKEVLSQINDEVDQVKQNLRSNVDKFILPILFKLKEKSQESDRISLDLLESQVLDIASPFLHDIELKFTKLTSREIEICYMIRRGLQSKEIGIALGISVRTVEKFRQKIRDKLCIGDRDTNLVTFLRLIDQKR
ncbi:MAG: PAS domain S-box protein, partial [Candidatus Zixiibacteriota bacterium]